MTKPAQILRELPRQIPLPTPITLQTPKLSSGNRKAPCSPGLFRAVSKDPVCGPKGLESAKPTAHSSSNNGDLSSFGPGVVLPAGDLKPLYDFALDCRTCQAKLAAAQADLADEKTKTVLLTHERDEAVRIAKGGSVLRRITRAAKWFAIGAVAGALAAKARP